ncbi:hypothetical protein [Rhodanobacter sp. MP1X3]|uniref:hypothetical protein n=1 Tax=Rhodanobacter sp. MP1X3 TaxID=2723086 RepID=UPI00161ACD58|nr:hypothetical protein [Rhodanobacter sp. MP1X3]MBB6240992.1 hypothetical protein [Rhodanobacter sp. MP1X3]
MAESAYTFDLIGCALRETRGADEVLTWHLKARPLFRKIPADDPFMDRDTFYTMAADIR